jgi:twinkle protein
MQFSDFNIKVPLGTTGNIKTICPACTPHMRKPANRNSKDLSVSIDQGIWNCHNCGWHGSLKVKAEKNYQKPVVIELPLSEKTVKWFGKRGITANTLKFFAITEKAEYMPQEGKDMNCVLFPYRKNSEWVNVKYRDGKKNFKLTKDAELIIFNYDAINGQKKVVITEGEIDAMSLHEVGFFAVCSVPNGAAKGNQRLEYLDNSWQAFSEAEEIIIATDSDDAGTALKNELIRRLGRDRCFEVTYPEGCKDFNEVLVKSGSAGVWDCIKAAKPLPLEGILRLTDFVFDLDDVYENGYLPGVTIGYPDFDGLINFSGGQVTIVTGVPNSGKSAFIDQMITRLAERHRWRFGLCSFENQPITRHAASLSACYVGKAFNHSDSAQKMNIDEYTKAKLFLQDHFFWFKMKDEDCTFDGILDRGRQLVKTYGIQGLLIDPYNYIEHKRPVGMTETEYVSQSLTNLSNFAKETDVHVFLVAHPTKIKKDAKTGDFEVPNLYDISGSAHFFNKTDNGITVHRNRATNLVTVYVQKIRFKNNGKLGNAQFTYDVNSGRYTPDGGFVFPGNVKNIQTGPASAVAQTVQNFSQDDLPF